MATAASPTPAAGSGHHSAALIRKSSLRSSGLRRPSSRSQLSRAESNPAPSAHGSKSQYAGNDSSDDEIPVPMKLSALTKALLNDEGAEPEREHGRVRTRAQSHRASSPVHSEQEKPVKRRSVLNASVTSIGEERRHTRANSAQASSRPTSPVRSQPSRESSPVRRRVVRLSSTSGTAAATAAAAQVKPAKRRSTSTSFSLSQSRNRPPSRDSAVEEKVNASEIRDKDLNTPAQQGRVVTIAVSSSGSRVRSSGSSVLSSRQAESASFLSHAGADENDGPEAPQTVPRYQGSSNPGSASRIGSNGARNRNEENQAMQSSMRVKRVGKVPGSFLSGPARRGRRRQSEEDAENERGQLRSGQDADGQQPQDPGDYEPVDNLASSYYVPDRLASGSPVSSRSSARVSYRRELSAAAGAEDVRVPRSRQTSPEHDEIPIPHYRIPPPRPEMPARHDQENEAPPTFRRSKPASSALPEKDMPKAPARPVSADVGALRPVSPERKALVSLSQNTPRRAAPPPPPKMSILDAATSAAGAATTAQVGKRRNYMKVNGKCYTRLDSLGRGGSGKVYRVAADNGKMFALKRVSTEGADENTIRGYKGEIDLLKKLNNVERVITLYDYEMNEEKQVLSLLMEMGELDLNTLLRLRLSPENARFDPVFVRYYWQEMLECLAAVHAHDIVHSDLKPANFVLVQGRLKLIDFGIANAIQTDETVNVHRETQIGTPNYMSPESLIDSNATDVNGHRISTNPVSGLSRPKLMKLGKPSDIWSLGCILYQMVYGTPPFGHIPNQMARCHAIINWQYDIEFRDRGVGGAPVPPSLLRTMRRCLSRDQHLRPTCAELLSRVDPFLYPVEASEGSLPITEELLGRIIQSVVTRCRERMPTEAEALSVWPQAYWGSVAKAVGREGLGAGGAPARTSPEGR